MMNESKLLYDRINEAITICGSQKKLCDIANISPVILSRFKGYYKKTTTIKDKRDKLSLNTLQKLADAINEDVSFFTDENYIKRKDRNNNIHIKDKELKPLLEDFITIFNNASIKDQGFLQGKLEQLINEFHELSTQRDNQINNTIKKTL